MRYLCLFVITFILVIFYYYLIELKKVKKLTKKGLPVELKLFLNMYNIDTKKEPYNSIMKKLIVLIACDTGIMLLITEFFSSIVVKIAVAIPCVLFLLIISYKLLGFYYKKKGLNITLLQKKLTLIKQ